MQLTSQPDFGDAERTAVVYRAGATAALGSVVTAVIVATFVRGTALMPWTLAWLAVVIALALQRFALFAAFRRAARPLDAAAHALWLRRFERSVAANGLAWGAGGVLMAVSADFLVQTIYALCLGGLFAGTVASYFIHLRAVLMFALPALAPFSIALLTHPTHESMVLGGGVLTFLGFASIVAVQIHDTLRDTLPVRGRLSQPAGASESTLEQRRIEHLYKTVWLTATGSLLGAACVVYLLRDSIDLRTAGLWMAALVAAAALRLHKVVEYRRKATVEAPTGYWLQGFNYPLVLVGLTWSVGAILLPQTLAGEMLMVVAVFGLVAGAVASFSSHLSTVLSLACVAALPFAISLILQADELHATLGIALLVFSAIMIVAGARVGRIIREGFAHEIENASLIEALTDRTATIEQLNDELETRVRLRTEELDLLVAQLSERSSQLELSRARYRDIVEQTDELIQSIDERGRVVFANRAWQDTLGYDAKALAEGLSIYDLLEAGARQPFRDAARKVAAGDSPVNLDCTLLSHDGARVEISGAMYPGGEEAGARLTLGVFRNVTAARAADAALRSSEARFNAIFSRSSIGILILDTDLRIVDANPHAHEILGHPLDTLCGNAIRTIVPPEHRNALEREIRGLFQSGASGTSLEMECTRGGQDVFWAELELSTIQDADGRARFIALILYDISQRKAIADVLQYNAAHDYLTGLINRREFERHLGEAIKAASHHHPHALVYLDLDRFKLINDVCGHSTGDAMLRRLSTDLAETIPPDCILARIGGDEFALLIPATSIGEAHLVTRALVTAIEDFRFEFENRTHAVGCSAGIVLLRGEESITEAMQSADAACYAAKRAGRNHIEIYNAEQYDMRMQRDQIRAATTLADALNANRLHLYAQPIAAIDEGALGKVEHYELLLRVESEDGEISGPAALLPAAEKYGYASEVDQWVVRETINALSRLGAADAGRLRLSVNLSAQSLQSEQFEHFLADQLHECMYRSSLCFEITESHLMSNLERATRFMRRMRQLGCRFALDDFGTGFSSYGYLKALNVDFLKIDGTFVRNIDSNPVDEAIVDSIVGVARAIRMRTIAEYVERDQQLEILARIGVDLAQGYLVGDEVPLARIIEQIDRARA